MQSLLETTTHIRSLNVDRASSTHLKRRAVEPVATSRGCARSGALAPFSRQFGRRFRREMPPYPGQAFGMCFYVVPPPSDLQLVLAGVMLADRLTT